MLRMMTTEALDGYSRIKLVITPAKGTGDARNQGLNAATGDYIGFVDGDDWAEPDMIEKLYVNLIKHNVQLIFIVIIIIDGMDVEIMVIFTLNHSMKMEVILTTHQINLMELRIQI